MTLAFPHIVSRSVHPNGMTSRCPDANGVIAITPSKDLDSFFAIGYAVVDEAAGDPTASFVVARRVRPVFEVLRT